MKNGVRTRQTSVGESNTPVLQEDKDKTHTPSAVELDISFYADSYSKFDSFLSKLQFPDCAADQLSHYEIDNSGNDKKDDKCVTV